ncbi:MAG: type II toxin-antitoxin system VapC family toxin [Chloroflexota bacterium]
MTEDIQKVFLDTAPLIYFVERDLRYWDTVSAIFQRIDGGRWTAVTSPVTLAECLVLPYRQNRLALLEQFIERVVYGENTLFVPFTENVARQAAEFRARYDLTLTDSFQLATCLISGCDAFLTNDRELRRVTEVNVLILSEMRMDA